MRINKQKKDIENSQVINGQSVELHQVFGDDDLIKKIYPGNNVKVIFSEDFMKKSKSFYGELPWLGRELIQNFIDANPHDRGTLNGVDIRFNKGKSENKILIRGNRDFEKPTALYKLDSGKADEENRAGGNGIGLKQTVLVLFRDYGIKDFIVRGETWLLQYQFLSADEINHRLKEQGIKEKVGKGRLVANVTQEEERKFTEYEIVTDSKDTTVFKGLQHMKEYGVYKEHPLLQNMEYTFPDLGGFKLLDNPDDMGALFLNGQKFRCKFDSTQSIKQEFAEKYHIKPFSSEQLYRGGPSGLTLFINAKYDMSIDRQPMGSDSIKQCMSIFLNKMTLQDIISLFVKTAPFWQKIMRIGGDISYYSYDSWSDQIPVIEHFMYQIVRRLSDSQEIINDFDGIFGNTLGNKNEFVACDIRDTSDLKKIAEKGYKLVPKYFMMLGIQGASLLAEKEKKDLSAEQIRQSHEEQAMGAGVSVPYMDFDEKDLKNERLFYGYTTHKLGKATVSYNDQVKTMAVRFDISLQKKHLYGIKTNRIMQDIRGLYVVGIQKGFFDSFVLYRDSYRVDFQYEDEELFVKLSNTERNYDCLTLEIGSEKFSPELVRSWTKNLNQKDIGVGRKGLVGPIFKKITFLMLICSLLFGAKYVVENFKKFSTDEFLNEWRSMKTGGPEHVSLGDMFTKGIHEIKNLIYNRKSIADFVSKYNQANIKQGHTAKTNLTEKENEELYRLLEKEEGPDGIENFKIVEHLSDAERKKLELLQTYMAVSLEVDIDNTLFLFEGNGVKGVNIGGFKIGLHESMMNVGFFEALNTFVHEAAHNYSPDHSANFIHANSDLLTAMLERYNVLLNDIVSGKKKPTEKEAFLLNADKYRDSLK